MSPTLEWVSPYPLFFTPQLKRPLRSRGHRVRRSEARVSLSGRPGLRPDPHPDPLSYRRRLRPISLSALPISVYSPVFARFTRRTADTTTTVKFTHEELEDARARSSSTPSLPTLRKPPELRTRGRWRGRSTRSILARSAFTLSGKTRCTPDGVVESTDKLGEFAPVLALCAVRAEIGEGPSDPAAEAECAYVAIYSSEEVRRPPGPALCSGSRR